MTFVKIGDQVVHLNMASDRFMRRRVYNCPTCGPDADGPKAWPASCDGLSTGQQDKVSAAVVRDLLSDKEGS